MLVGIEALHTVSGVGALIAELRALLALVLLRCEVQGRTRIHTDPIQEQ